MPPTNPATGPITVPPGPHAAPWAMARMRLAAWLQALRPARPTIDWRERSRIVGGAALGLLLAALLSHAWATSAGGPSALPWLVAPLGASAVLVFGLPASPLAQPWAVVGGNTVSALVGVACAQWVPWPEGAAALAVAGAIGAMLLLRCLHPPGGAAALLAVLTGSTDWHFALTPVALNSSLLVLAGLLYNPLTGRRYPHAQGVAPVPIASRHTDTGPPTAPLTDTFTERDLDAVLARYNQLLDVPRDDLHRLLEQAEQAAHQRHLQTLRCRDIMSAPAVAVEFGTALDEAWALLRRHRIKALPVVDRYGHVVGIVTQADFLRHADLDHADGPSGLDGRLRRLLQRTPGAASDKPEVVGQVMTRQVRVASADRPIQALVPLFSSSGHHHVPIIGARNRLVGIVTQTDLVAALARQATEA